MVKMAGKPKIIWTEEQIDQIKQMALDNCHTETIARSLGTTSDTIKAHFSKLLKRKRAEGRAILRRSQHEMALKQPVMAIWLGKQELEQTDRQDHKHTLTNFADIMKAIVGEKG